MTPIYTPNPEEKEDMKHPKLTYKVETITPAQAARYLEDQGRNRKVKRGVVERYASDMRNGKWEVTGQGLVFAKDGKLLNGQHRLLACIESSKTFPTLVVRGVEAKAFAKMDVGSNRTAGDVLSAAGYSRATLVAAASRVLMGLHDLETTRAKASTTESRVSWNKNVTHTQIKDYAKVHSTDIYEAIEQVATADAGVILRPASLFVAVRTRLGRANATRSHEFFDGLISGADLSKTDPRGLLRNMLIKAATEKTLRRSAAWKVAVTIKTWNAWLTGKKVRSLRWGDAEDWPKIRHRLQIAESA